MRKIIINTLAIFVTINLHTHAQKRGEVPTFQWGTTGKQIDLSWAAEVGSRVEDNQSTNTFYWQAQTSISIPNSGLELQVSKWYGHRL